MSDSTTDKPASNELQKLEQAVEADQTESTDASPQETSEPTAFEKLAEKKGFKDADDMARAYENVEGMSTRLSQEVKGLSEEIRKVATPQADDPLANASPEQQEALKMLRSVVDDVVDKKIQPLREDTQVRKAREEIESVKSELHGISDYEIQDAVAMVKNNPSLSLSDAAKVVSYGRVTTNSVVQQGKAEKSQAKNRAFVETAKTSKSDGSVDYSKLTLEELENILPSSGDFIDSKGTLRKG
ncbi:MAG: hypothetical protein DRP09_11010 [Candidatus Thorarchaeota archaeon]|nr:MAG: hypothetical protein DRP09_11010 [Candidatus Thorarchaeota archaeon]